MNLKDSMPATNRIKLRQFSRNLLIVMKLWHWRLSTNKSLKMSFTVKFIQLYSSAETVKKATVIFIFYRQQTDSIIIFYYKSISRIDFQLKSHNTLEITHTWNMNSISVCQSNEHRRNDSVLVNATVNPLWLLCQQLAE